MFPLRCRSLISGFLSETAQLYAIEVMLTLILRIFNGEIWLKPGLVPISVALVKVRAALSDRDSKVLPVEHQAVQLEEFNEEDSKILHWVNFIITYLGMLLRMVVAIRPAESILNIALTCRKLIAKQIVE